MLGLLRSSYYRRDVEHLHGFLEENGTFGFRRFANGLFPAAPFAGEQDASGYGHAWVRDNVHVAHAHYVWGDSEAAVRTANALMRFFQGQRPRMQKVAKYPRMAENAMNRPHIRFEGETMRELPEKWPHAQNDALGYFLWFYSKLAGEHRVGFGEEEKRCMADLVRYLRAIRYWEDPDSGHWEEVKKVSASSIGAVVAGLSGLQQLLDSPSGREGPEKTPDRADVAELIGKGKAALDQILPYECRGHKNGGQRRYDAALLFLIYPLRVVSGAMARSILGDVKTNLQGIIGIRRYIRDSYWCPDYR
ncbi:MAG TPA: glycoside hydrolase family 15 protein, partial [Desulfosalsimonadaceae bacterium]|nr:glycoside hydrolase family 15 protein [Desulfosalsimonadaceae bacterium]